jgi:ubiquinone/menaquinone biosynthesis C-methylase UbiE
MNFQCTTDKYAKLYARWLEKPGGLLDLAKYEPGHQLLDLCGGTGAVSLEALRRGADPSTILLMDLNPRCPDRRIEQIPGDVGAMGPAMRRQRHHRFDLIVIRQAAAYLTWDWELVLWLQTLLKPGGKLVFNTFMQPKWGLRTYKYGARRYLEASCYFGKTVWHLQASPLIGWDISKFRFHSGTELRQTLSLAFTVTTKQQGRSVYWVCTARGA